MQKNCLGCKNEIPVLLVRCHHCGEAFNPNVDLANHASEVDVLKTRYETQYELAKKRGVESKLKAFEHFVESAHVVMCRKLKDLIPVVASTNQVAATFYERGTTDLRAGSHVFEGEKWNAIRPAAETALFGDEVKKQIHFAALSPDQIGLKNYGEVSVTLRTKMISSRTSLLEKNMLVFFKEHAERYWTEEHLLKGFRASWGKRTMLAVAKLAEKVELPMTESDFAAILLTEGEETSDDEFIEVHIYGQISAKTFDVVTLTKNPVGVNRTQIRAFKEDVEKNGGTWVDKSTML